MKYLTFGLVAVLALFFSSQAMLQNNPTMLTEKPTLLYFGDPMCSWCYGFSPQLSTAIEELGNAVELKLVMGGLRPYGTETMEELDDFLKEHWGHVEEASSQPFSYNILEDKAFVYDTEPPSRAVLVARKMKPAIAFDFFKSIQKAFYVENKNTGDLATYLELAEQFGLDAQAFQEAYLSEEMKSATSAEFEYAASLGVRGFPTVILKQGTEYTLISNGFEKAENIVAAVQRLL